MYKSALLSVLSILKQRLELEMSAKVQKELVSKEVLYSYTRLVEFSENEMDWESSVRPVPPSAKHMIDLFSGLWFRCLN